MKSKETILILSEIANTLDRNLLFKEASDITRVMNRIVLSQDVASDSSRDEKDSPKYNASNSENDDSETSKSPVDPKPTSGQEKQYQIAIQRLKNELFSGARKPKEIYNFVFASESDPSGFYQTFVSNGALTLKQYEAFKIQIKSILSRFSDINSEEKPNAPKSVRVVDNTIQKLLNLYMKQKNLSIRDLLNQDTISKAQSSIEKVISKNQLFKEKKSELLSHLQRTMSSYREASRKNNIKIAQIQTNKYKSEDINIIEQNNGNFLDVHNLGKLYPNETFTAIQAQSLANRIYKRDKNLVDNQLTFQSRHNDNDTLDIIVDIK